MKLWFCCNSFYENLCITDKQRQVDIRCLQAATERFLKSGSKDDAFDVYFCFSEIFCVFGAGYEGTTQTMLDILADHESNAGSILDKFRDHYSHAVYNFALGISLYQINKGFQKVFEDFYPSKKYSIHEEFLYRWGLSSLFHDVGYPFEIAFNGIKEYTNDVFNKFTPLLQYNISAFIENTEAVSDEIAPKSRFFSLKNCHELIAEKIAECFNFDYRSVLDKLNAHIPAANKFMDHAYFGAIIMLKKLLEKGRISEQSVYLDTAMTILLHSSFWRRKLAETIKLTPKMHPLVFLLNLCDELQVFNRIGYGHLSKEEPLPRTAYFDSENEGIIIVYSFGDEALKFKPDGINVDTSFINRTKKKVEDEMKKLFDLSEFGNIKIEVAINNYEKPVVHSSTSFFRYIFEIAVQIHRSYLDNANAKFNDVLNEWDKLSLEHKMSNILAAKSYADKLAIFNYFYDDKTLSFDKIKKLADNEIETLARIEHERWMDEKKSMGWIYEDYDVTDEKIYKKKRAEKKHNCIKPFDELSARDKDKDREVIRNMIPNLTIKREGKTGFNVYKSVFSKQESAPYYVGITGHRHEKIAKFDTVKLESDIKSAFLRVFEIYGKNVIVLNSLADGFDLLAAKIATEFKWGIRGVLPVRSDEYKSNIFDQNTLNYILGYSKYTEMLMPELYENIYVDMSRYIASNCDELVCAWGGQPSENIGGTYYTVKYVEKMNNESSVSKQRRIVNLLKNQIKSV